MVEGLGFRVFRVWRRGVEVVWGLGCLGFGGEGFKCRGSALFGLRGVGSV